MPNNRALQKLALHGSQKAVTRIEGKGQPKLGTDELLSVVERFGVSRRGLQRIKKIAEALKKSGQWKGEGRAGQ